MIFIVLFGEANKSYIEKINKKYNINLEAIQSIGFGVCNNSDYASQTCKNYLRYFENSLERSIAQIKKEEIEKYHTEKVKNKFY